MKAPPIVPSHESVSRASLVESFPEGGLFQKVDDKITQVVPAGLTMKHEGSSIKRNLQATQGRKLSFFQAFGVFGVPMLVIMVLCLVWTAWLIFVSLAPNEAANVLMGTRDYDNGQFWLIIDTQLNLTCAGVIGLVLVWLCYLFVALKMILWREKVLTPAVLRRLEERLLGSWKSSRLETRTWSIVVGPWYRNIQSLWQDFTSFNGKKRKLWNVYTKVVDLVMQTIVLLQLLKRGSPVELVYGYACFVALNSLSCATNILSDRFSTLTEVLIDSIFDFSAAVLFPIATLVFCYYNFEFDREVYLTYLEKLVPGSFEHIARLFADQSEIALFRVSFDSLRFSSPLDLVIRIAMSLVFCYRIKRVMEVMIWRRHHSWVSRRNLKRSSDNIIVLEQKKPIPRFIGVVFVAYSVIAVVGTQQSFSSSSTACSVYPECAVYAYRWRSSDGLCPCIIFIDVDKAPKTYGEWVNPPEAYNKLKAVSSSGMLESIQVINRHLLEFPDELRTCRNLKSIQLIYTSTQAMPSWVADFRHLETFHIEGKQGSLNLRELPENIFSNMPNLVMIHLGVHENLQRVPPLTGVPHLQSLSIAWMFRLHELPSFDYIPDLRRIVLAVLPVLEWIPDVSRLRKLVDFTVLPGIICCNGFLGTCDLTNVYCLGMPFVGIPPAKCLMNTTDPTLPASPYLGSLATKTAFQKFGMNVCYKLPFEAVYIDNSPTTETIETCGGKPFRQCHLPGNITGICYNTRLQVLSCSNDESHIALRRFQIETGVVVCDPVEEKWLGCGETKTDT